MTIRWLMLHRRERPRRGASVDAAAAAEASREAEQLLLLIMNTSQFEYNLRKLISSLLERKETMWAECRAQADERLLELADFFSGTKALTRVGGRAAAGVVWSACNSGARARLGRRDVGGA